ncbi:unnamed protein product [Amoebophrya sp. A120]|nr:unnamed protein product [Amoebophrya sp. A120]|eukprot:GSA120T00025388001.1
MTRSPVTPPGAVSGASEAVRQHNEKLMMANKKCKTGLFGGVSVVAKKYSPAVVMVVAVAYYYFSTLSQHPDSLPEHEVVVVDHGNKVDNSTAMNKPSTDPSTSTTPFVLRDENYKNHTTNDTALRKMMDNNKTRNTTTPLDAYLLSILAEQQKYTNLFTWLKTDCSAVGLDNVRIGYATYTARKKAPMRGLVAAKDLRAGEDIACISRKCWLGPINMPKRYEMLTKKYPEECSTRSPFSLWVAEEMAQKREASAFKHYFPMLMSAEDYLRSGHPMYWLDGAARELRIKLQRRNSTEGGKMEKRTQQNAAKTTTSTGKKNEETDATTTTAVHLLSSEQEDSVRPWMPPHIHQSYWLEYRIKPLRRCYRKYLQEYTQEDGLFWGDEVIPISETQNSRGTGVEHTSNNYPRRRPVPPDLAEYALLLLENRAFLPDQAGLEPLLDMTNNAPRKELNALYYQKVHRHDTVRSIAARLDKRKALAIQRAKVLKNSTNASTTAELNKTIFELAARELVKAVKPENSRWSCLVAKRNLTKGEAILTSYGIAKKGPWRAMQQYGFSYPDPEEYDENVRIPPNITAVLCANLTELLNLPENATLFRDNPVANTYRGFAASWCRNITSAAGADWGRQGDALDSAGFFNATVSTGAATEVTPADDSINEALEQHVLPLEEKPNAASTSGSV